MRKRLREKREREEFGLLSSLRYMFGWGSDQLLCDLPGKLTLDSVSFFYLKPFSKCSARYYSPAKGLVPIPNSVFKLELQI